MFCQNQQKLDSVSSVTEFVANSGGVISTPGLIFIYTKEEGEAIEEALLHQGIPCTFVHGECTDEERLSIKQALRSGEIQWAIATDVWATGVDIPELKTIVLALSGSAPIGLKQKLGRGMRLHSGKNDFTIYDLSLGSPEHVKRRKDAYESLGLSWTIAAPEAAHTRDADCSSLCSHQHLAETFAAHLGSLCVDVFFASWGGIKLGPLLTVAFLVKGIASLL